MTYYLFASYGTETYVVEAESEDAAKGKMWEEDTIHNVEFVGSVEDFLGEDDVSKVNPYD